jgi:hypothetical protein
MYGESSRNGLFSRGYTVQGGEERNPFRGPSCWLAAKKCPSRFHHHQARLPGICGTKRTASRFQAKVPRNIGFLWDLINAAANQPEP